MLREIRIKNFAVIETVTVPFAPGLNVLTGETGAGKSIVIDAILLVSGGRGQTDVIRSDAETATVEAVFDLPRGGGARGVLEEAGIPADESALVIRRELARSGRHRAFVNDSPVTVGLLERLGEQLAEIHGQHEHQRLLQPLAQLELLDRFADAEDAVARMAALHAEYRAAAQELERLRGADRDRAQREDLLRFQVSELDAARLRVGEEEELRAERRQWQHAERFSSGLVEVTQLLLEDRDAAAGRVARAARVLGDLGRLDGAFADAATPLDAAAAQIEEAMPAVRELRELGVERTRFDIAVEAAPAEQIQARGLDHVEFRLSANPGEDPRPLARVASGGELSRTMLAVEVVLANYERVPTMVFDEVDAGVGARVAGTVADKLAVTARGRQVLCVTHLAPIAARAGHHLLVAKAVRAGRTRAGVAVLSGAARVEEIARMLGGERLTDTARRHARELLAGK